MTDDIEVMPVMREIPLKGIRKTIASRLGGIWREAVHVTFHRQIDVSILYENKKSLRHSLIDYLQYALVCTLDSASFRRFNATFEGEVLREIGQVNLGIAFDHPRGLIVPVLHGANRLSLDRFALQRKELTHRAAAGRLIAGELDNGTFTVTNLGTMGIDFFSPILNPPQTAILGFGRVRFEHSASSWEAVPERRALLGISLTVDHRVVDGADAARFLMAYAAGFERLVRKEAGEIAQ